ncbi:hypothetical protein AMTRI_Chr01g128070 [Amborella trichopoda]
MPVGVPKVPFRSPGDEDATWKDYFFLGQEVEGEISNQIVGLMVYLRIAIYDAMQFVPPNVHTICMGLATSMGSLVLAG